MLDKIRQKNVMSQMQFVSVIEDKIYLCWQQEVQLFNFRQLGIAESLWIVVLYSGDKPNYDLLQKLYQFHPCPNQIKCIKNTQPRHILNDYVAMNKPWGISQLLKQEPTVGKALFSIDSDVWLKAPMDFAFLVRDVWYGSDCTSYLSWRHWRNDKKLTPQEIKRIVNITGIDVDTYKVLDRCIGAQLIFTDVTSDFFDMVTTDAWRMHDALKEIHEDGKENQFWVAEMLSFLLHMLKQKGQLRLQDHSSLQFAWADTKDGEWYDRCNIVHMAGPFNRDGPFFCKQLYNQQAPWDHPLGLKHAAESGATRDYVALVRAYAKSIGKEI